MQIVAALRASRAGNDPTRSTYHIRVEPFKGLYISRVMCIGREARSTS